MPAGALAGTKTSTSSQITPTAPSRLSSTATSTTPTTSTVATRSAAAGADLPDTGLDLLPETVLGIALVGAGVGLRVHRARG